MTTERAIFGAGCFWSPEKYFGETAGVFKVTSGYSGGDKVDPTYKEVCSGRTGHTEVVEVEYDPEKVSYEQLLEVFWAIHDPTQGNRQGPDVGTQYRSAIYYFNEDQHAAAVKSMAMERATVDRPISTEVAAAGPFYAAEDYHQDFLANNPMYACHLPRRKVRQLDAS